MIEWVGSPAQIPVYLPHLEAIASANEVSLEQVLVAAIMSRLKGEQFPNWLKQLFKDSTNLLPEVWSPARSWETLEPASGEKRKRGPGIPVSQMDPDEDEWWKTLFPARAKKDLSIRRLRWRDVWHCSVRTVGLSESSRRLHICRGLDYISSANLMLFGLLMGREWWRRWEQRGTWDLAIDDMIKDLKYVSDEIKKHGIRDIVDWSKYVECAGLFGYKNHYEGDGFDKVEQARGLAEGGGGDRRSPDPEVPWLVYFERVAREELMSVPLDAPKYLSFTEFVSDAANWETAGSSSTGYMRWKFGDEEGKFKVRKNLLPDVVKLQTLINDALTKYKQVNIAIEKNELGKIRIAVASDIETYLRQAWILYLCNHWYVHWPGSTIEEGTTLQYRRMVEMLETVKTHWSLPFDYAGFDHQPWAEEVLILVRLVHERGARAVPLEGMAEYRKICELDELGFKNATLAVKETAGGETKEKVFPVTGGVMSGLRYTTLLGNGWNTVMTRISKDYLEAAGVPANVVSWIRGDDSAIFTPSYFEALLMRQALQTVGAIGNDEKFGIHGHATEFLRTWYAERCYGYPGRMIPNLVQRKPWSAEPLNPADQWTVYRGIIDALIRRGCDVEACELVWDTLASRYCSKYNVPRSFFGTPRAMGGLGVEEFVAAEVAGPVPSTDGLKIEFQGTTDYRENKWKARAEELGYSISESDARALSDEDRMSKVSGDDIMAFSAAVRPQFREKLKEVRARPVSDDYCVNTLLTACTIAEGPHAQGEHWLKRQIASAEEVLNGVNFGRLSHLATTFQDIRRLDPSLKIRDTFKKIDAMEGTDSCLVWQSVRKYLPPMVAKDWVLGSAVASQPSGRNGMFDKLVSLTTMVAVSKTWSEYPFRRDNVALLRTVSRTVRAVSKTYSSTLPVKLVDGW